MKHRYINFLRVVALGVVAIFALSCERDGCDTQYIAFEQKKIEVGPEGCSELIIPIRATGGDLTAYITPIYRNDYDVDENGHRIPRDPWVKIIKIIDEYDPTRAFPPTEDSAIVVEIKPYNEPGYIRTASLWAESWGVKDWIRIEQSGGEKNR